MSDPVSNAEIEDVLSSIRRLISAGHPDQKDEVQTSEPADNKLILTPAFRVFGGDTAKATDVDGRNVSAHPATGRDIPVEMLEQGDLSPTKAVEDVVNNDDAKVIPPLILSFDTNIAEPGLQSSADIRMPSVDSQVDFEDNWDSDALGETAQVAFLHERVTRVAANNPAEDVEQELATEDAGEAEAETMIESEEPTIGDAPDLDETPELTSDQDGIADVDLSASDNEAAEDDAELIPEDDVEDTTVLGDVGVEDLSVEMAEEDTGTEALIATVESAPVAEIIEDDSDFIDEDHLQEIVSRIVREELKGEMGVKITQAVRRMVRREVTRALSLEKFD